MTEEIHMPDSGTPENPTNAGSNDPKAEGTPKNGAAESKSEGPQGRNPGKKPERGDEETRNSEGQENDAREEDEGGREDEGATEKTHDEEDPWEKFQKSLSEVRDDPEHPDFTKGSESLFSRELYEKIAEDIFDKNVTTERLIDIGKKNKFPPKQYALLLKSVGQPQEKIDDVVNSGELPEEPEKGEEDQEDMEEIEEANKEGDLVEQLSAMNKDAAGLLSRAESGEATKEDLAEFKAKSNTLMDKVHEWLFNGDRGLLRPEKRLTRLVLKPLVTLLLITLVTYVALIAMLTRRSAEKIK